MTVVVAFAGIIQNGQETEARVVSIAQAVAVAQVCTAAVLFASKRVFRHHGGHLRACGIFLTLSGYISWYIFIISNQVPCLILRPGSSGGLKSGSHVWLGMGVNNSEKFILEFSNHKRPQTTTLDHGHPHQKQ